MARTKFIKDDCVRLDKRYNSRLPQWKRRRYKRFSNRLYGFCVGKS